MNIQEKVTAFRNTFGFNPPLDIVTGFLEGKHTLNIFEFDKQLCCPKEVKLIDFVREKYGEQAVQIVLDLM